MLAKDRGALQQSRGARGRGATDDKGPALSVLLGARFAIDQGLPINIRFLWELEEEIGSPHFAVGLRQRALVPCPDSVVVSDTIWIAKGQPAAALERLIVTVAEAPFASVPMMQMIGAVPEHGPAVDDAETSVAPAGTVARSWTPGDASGPPSSGIRVGPPRLSGASAPTSRRS